MPNIFCDYCFLFLICYNFINFLWFSFTVYKIPIGGSLDYIDEVTLKQALEGRKDV
ncbi:hypothetical protein [Spiroplasma endosymbiont of Polydrusus cervinus]|uniref:hypothetical protein n=1 Tax=Spiroplasma endosymbiont of Polydrusus cervinus TaxID=3066287 RepID=UPI0030CB3302